MFENGLPDAGSLFGWCDAFSAGAWNEHEATLRASVGEPIGRPGDDAIGTGHSGPSRAKGRLTLKGDDELGQLRDGLSSGADVNSAVPGCFVAVGRGHVALIRFVVESPHEKTNHCSGVGIFALSVGLLGLGCRPRRDGNRHARDVDIR